MIEVFVEKSLGNSDMGSVASRQPWEKVKLAIKLGCQIGGRQISIVDDRSWER